MNKSTHKGVLLTKMYSLELRNTIETKRTSRNQMALNVNIIFEKESLTVSKKIEERYILFSYFCFFG